jgi:hypothetical protein
VLADEPARLMLQNCTLCLLAKHPGQPASCEGHDAAEQRAVAFANLRAVEPFFVSAVGRSQEQHTERLCLGRIAACNRRGEDRVSAWAKHACWEWYVVCARRDPNRQTER